MTAIPSNNNLLRLPARTGIGLRSVHYQQILTEQPNIPWLEVHSENYFSKGGYPNYYLEKIREHYPISLHGVSLSLGSHDPLNIEHLQCLKLLIKHINPCLVSEHLSWSSIDNRYLHDLLPLPYTAETLAHVAVRIKQAQDFLGRQLLIENISYYMAFAHSVIPEWEFLAELVKQTGCGILLDINNLYVNAHNLNSDPNHYFQYLPADSIQEIHLAGYSTAKINEQQVLIDTHSQPVSKEVWNLYQQAINNFGPKPTLIEWDSEIPALEILMQEAKKADHFLQEHSINVS